MVAPGIENWRDRLIALRRHRRTHRSVTPECFVMDSSRTIRYHGSIDDNMNESRVQNRRLRLTLDAPLGGKARPVHRKLRTGATVLSPCAAMGGPTALLPRNAS
jgi:hypothetical protein